jgi:general secretion pathway protein I
MKRLCLATPIFRTDSESGFTLMEVMIAFVISALALGVLFSGTTQGLRATEQAGKYAEAISLARSHLAAIGHGAAIAQQDTSGTDGDGFDWHLHVQPLGTRHLTLSDSDRANDTPSTMAILYDIAVTESWKDAGRTRRLVLATHRFDVRTASGAAPSDD